MAFAEAERGVVLSVRFYRGDKTLVVLSTAIPKSDFYKAIFVIADGQNRWSKVHVIRFREKEDKTRGD